MKHIFNLLLAIVLLGSCSGAGNKNNDAMQSKPVEVVHATADQVLRRQQSEAYCTAHGVPVYSNKNALFPPPADSVTLRTSDEVINRTLALLYIGLKSEGLDQEGLDEINTDYGIYEKLSPKEKAYVFAKEPEEQQKIDANWRYEAMHVLLWSLGYIDTLAFPNQVCDVAADVKIIHDLTPADFRKQARLRSKTEILDMNDRVLRLHWACVESRVNKKPAPAALDEDVVREWHHALNWLIRHLAQDWDKITTNT
jgi:hypothetical protein